MEDTMKLKKKARKKKARGRPRKNLTTRLSVSFTAAQEDKLLAYCEVTGRGLADAVRDAVRAWVPDHTDFVDG